MASLASQKGAKRPYVETKCVENCLQTNTPPKPPPLCVTFINSRLTLSLHISEELDAIFPYHEGLAAVAVR